ncbi:MAG: LL-diaminopimelate aminotransferase [Parachlamydia sp.]|nr:LL-diaminopimelate aminotransferase [Parachlamydia sp.]
MTKRNPNLAKLKTSYLFPTIHQRKQEYLAAHPEAKLISLGIGDTTLPIVPHVVEAMEASANLLGTPEGYTGYGPDQGEPELRKKIASQFYENRVKPEEIFISDGAKCDIGRLQLLFGKEARIAIQDPAYPVYGDGSLMQGVSEIHFLPCLPENNFFPRFDKSLDVDLIYICSPNNPTGAVATHEQLEELVAYAKERHAIILFDSAYGCFIQDPSLPRSIFEIEGAREVALEISSFSKVAGFTGVRLAWTVVPDTLRFDDGSPIIRDWHRVMTTLFNGASHISQMGGLAVLDPQGLQETRAQVLHYLENGAILRRALEKKGFEVFGGVHAPYLWVDLKGQKSWDVFQLFLEKLHIVTTPGAGFGSSGEGFLRLTSFGLRPHTLEAAERISTFHFP